MFATRERGATFPRQRPRLAPVANLRDSLRRVMFDVGALPYAVLTSQPTWRAHGGDLAEHVELVPGGHVLDLGCGPGESAFGMIDRVPGARVTGLDISGSMIRFARLRQRFERHRDRVQFVEGDAMALEFPDATFDAVTGHSFLYLVPNAERVLAEVSRVLKPGGRCAFLEPAGLPGSSIPRAIAGRALREPRFVTSMALWRIVSRGYGRFDEARFAASFRRAGLDLVRVQTTLAGMGVFGVGKRPENPADFE